MQIQKFSGRTQSAASLPGSRQPGPRRRALPALASLASLLLAGCQSLTVPKLCHSPRPGVTVCAELRDGTLSGSARLGDGKSAVELSADLPLPRRAGLAK